VKWLIFLRKKLQINKRPKTGKQEVVQATPKMSRKMKTPPNFGFTGFSVLFIQIL